MSQMLAKPAKKLSGTIQIPGDKSISHRAIMLASIADGISQISGILASDDVISTIKAFQNMGVKIERDSDNVRVFGVGLFGLKKPAKPLDLGNSGTSMRLILGLLAAQKFDSELCGDASLSKRPMGRVITPLAKMGAVVSSIDGKPPLKITGGKSLQGINYQLPVASAQVKSAILLAGLYATGQTCITEYAPTRDHTERMLTRFGVMVKQICLDGGNSLKSVDITVPSDISSAAFFMVAASISKSADIMLPQVNINPTRTGIIAILQLMGANISLENQAEIGGELVADIRVRSADLHGITIPAELVPLAIDEFPAIFIAAAVANGETILQDAAELRVKESDRIQVMADGLSILGIKNEVLADGIKITGGSFKKPTAAINTHFDHRIAMAFAIASASCDFAIKINGSEHITTSFPNFTTLANSIGFDLQ